MTVAFGELQMLQKGQGFQLYIIDDCNYFILYFIFLNRLDSTALRRGDLSPVIGT